VREELLVSFQSTLSTTSKKHDDKKGVSFDFVKTAKKKNAQERLFVWKSFTTSSEQIHYWPA